MMNAQGRPTTPGRADKTSPETISHHRGLDHEEPLIFEIGREHVSGVDLPETDLTRNRLGGLTRKGTIGLCGLSEPEAVRHYVRLSQRNASIDASFYPLGSCTMKHNPRLNEKMARLAGFCDIHPMQPQKTVQGAFALIAELARWLKELTGMPAVAMSPKAGAHGELCGILAIRAALEDAKSSGGRQVLLEVRSSNQGGIALYERMGFLICGRRANYYRNPAEDAVLLVFQLPGTNE
jgi:glycine dehydrogenase subunit 2